MPRIINLTHHAITIYSEDGAMVEKTIPICDLPIPRVTEHVLNLPRESEEIGIPCVCKVTGSVKDLPDPTPDTIFIVSGFTAQRANREGRKDVFAPDTGPGSIIRGSDGVPVGVKRLCRFVDALDQD